MNPTALFNRYKKKKEQYLKKLEDRIQNEEMSVKELLAYVETCCQIYDSILVNAKVLGLISPTGTPTEEDPLSKCSDDELLELMEEAKKSIHSQ